MTGHYIIAEPEYSLGPMSYSLYHDIQGAAATISALASVKPAIMPPICSLSEVALARLFSMSARRETKLILVFEGIPILNTHLQEFHTQSPG